MDRGGSGEWEKNTKQFYCYQSLFAVDVTVQTTKKASHKDFDFQVLLTKS